MGGWDVSLFGFRMNMIASYIKIIFGGVNFVLDHMGIFGENGNFLVFQTKIYSYIFLYLGLRIKVKVWTEEERKYYTTSYNF